jgi:DNA gyrase subunit A
VVQEDDELTLISAEGLALRIKVKDISRSRRVARGTLLISLKEKDLLVSVARMSAADLRQVGVPQEEQN